MTYVYKSASNQWIFFDGTTKHFYESELEARRTMAKTNTAKAVVSAVQSLAPATDSAAALEAEYFDIGGWTDEDVAALGITADDLAACITLLQQIKALMIGNETTPAVYRTTLNRVRRVSA
jgi:hypothetical protein